MSLKDIAQSCGVSVATVSYVLSGKKRMSSELQEKIINEAKAQNYRVNRMGQALRTGKTNTIGLIIPTLIDSFFPLLAEAIARRCRTLGWAVIFYETTGGDEEISKAISYFSDFFVAGIILVAPPVCEEKIEDIETPVPLIVVDQDNDRFVSVRTDDEKGAALQAECAWELGHRNIAYIAGPKEAPCSERRVRGFVNRAKELGLNVVFTTNSPYSKYLSPEAISKLKEFEGRFSFVATGNDTISLGLIRHLSYQGMKIPQDISVVGFDDALFSDIMIPTLSTVRQDVSEIARVALECLLDEIDGNPHDSVSILVNPKLILRYSSQVCNKR